MDRQKVLITGAASGIGRSTAIRFANEGFDVCLNDIKAKELSSVASILPPGNHLCLSGDYTQKEVMAEGEKLIGNYWGKIDVLVNCAGVFEKTYPIEMDLGQWRRILDIMLNGCYIISQLAIKFMKENGRIIHISSIHGTRVEKYASSYSVAKAAIDHIVGAWHLNLRVRVF